jgi:hypothetical protein
MGAAVPIVGHGYAGPPSNGLHAVLVIARRTAISNVGLLRVPMSRHEDRIVEVL